MRCERSRGLSAVALLRTYWLKRRNTARGEEEVTDEKDQGILSCFGDGKDTFA